MIILLLLLVPSACALNYSTSHTDLPQLHDIAIRKVITDTSNILLRTIWPIISDQASNPNTSLPCTSSLIKAFLAFKRQDPWMIKMVLANGFLPSNPLEGGSISLGGYEQCLNTRSPGFKGMYCLLFLHLPENFLKEVVGWFDKVGELQGRFNPLTATVGTASGKLPLRIGICVPSACTEKDIVALASPVFQNYGVLAKVRGCRTDDPKEVTPLQLFSLSMLSALGFIVLLATLAEWCLQGVAPKVLVMRILLMFSATSNTKDLLKTSGKGLNQSLLFLSGMKVICAYWVLLAHEYIALQPEFLHSPFELLRLGSTLRFQFIANSVLSVTTFFVMSGFLLSFTMLHAQPTLYVFFTCIAKRYIRLTLPVMATVLVAFLLPLIANGPADQDLILEQIRGCTSHWWTLMAQVNNFTPLHERCLSHLWYVSAEMQIFTFIALPLALLLCRYRKIGLTLSVTLVLTFATIATIQTYSWQLFYGITFGTNDGRRFAATLELIHFRPFVHVPEYVCGVVCGYLAVRYQKYQLRKVIEIVLWLASLGLVSFVMFVTVPWNEGRMPDGLTNAIYGGCHRVLWSIGLFWPMFACATKNEGLLKKFLSWNVFIPLSRLTYGIYLVHLLFHLLRMANTKTAIDVDEYLQLRNSIGTFGLSVFLAYLLYLTCEAPAQHLCKLLFVRPKSSPVPTVSTTETTLK